MLWTDEEIRELISLWPTHSAAQLAMRLHRPKSAITGKVKRLRQEGVLPLEGIKHYDVARVQARSRPTRGSTASSGGCSAKGSRFVGALGEARDGMAGRLACSPRSVNRTWVVDRPTP